MSLKSGEWIDAYDGIAQVYSCNKFYTEEFSDDYKATFQVGEPSHEVVIYKLLCDFKGKPSNRQIFRHCSRKLCTPICSKSADVLGELKNAHPEHFAKYESRYKVKVIPHIIGVTTTVEEKYVEPLHDFLNEFAKTLDTPFTYEPIHKDLLEHFPEANLFNRDQFRKNNNLVIRLHNDDYIVRDKRAVLTKMEAVIR